ncbi:hypothetical protein CDD80_5840 [Ophiocordyceps camponoti-rufipedis]|uniref:FAR1 domain-containing protein n=1 Tax=Ophiocordyceps camponoti-rufipedis TaxID=2004952 RepID=A0A2C5ZM92_9HYPO|nr:hypothetical protein CDD80_5840 [Ophiocordyceps camponoti-rufipedis]
MEALEDQTFPSWTVAAEACHATAKAGGYALAVACKRPNAHNPSYVLFRCSKGRQYSSSANPNIPECKRRQTMTKKTGCPFRVALKLKSATGLWSIRVTDEEHNHTMTIYPITHAKYRAELLHRHLDYILGLTKDGVRPMQIAYKLWDRDQELIGIDAKAVSYVLARYRRHALPPRRIDASPGEQEAEEGEGS